ncbi:MAG: EscN/YscN/HrcN family type III secretion system ATPase, partial [Phycisphaerales bacterium]|nr:EscN/YscN/HrcN family type III secretion system ATPase [Phycisphaerales bacterium]
GSITGLYTILVEGDDMSEPISDAARGILDGHVILSRKLAQKGHFPAIDVLDSVSRVAGDVSDSGHTAARHQIMRLLAAYHDVEDLVQIGAYASGANPDTDTAIDMVGVINELLMQRTDEQAAFDPAQQMLMKLALQSGEMIAQRKKIMSSGQQAPANPFIQR